MHNLQTWIDEHGKRDEDVAEAVGISRVQVSRIRRGKSYARPDTAEKLADLVGGEWTDFIKPPAKQNA
jgi:transcriptional regulator with XRE-family HTH domain